MAHEHAPDLTPIQSSDLPRALTGHLSASSTPRSALPPQRRTPFHRLLQEAPLTAQPLTASSSRPCSHCGRSIGTACTLRGSVPWYYWRVCVCQEAQVGAHEAQIAATVGSMHQQQADKLLGDTGMRRIAHLTLDRFDPHRLRPVAVQGGTMHPYDVATAWLNAILAYGPAPDVRDPDAPPAALYFYSPIRGCGKTHLAAGLLWEARQLRKLTAFIEEETYLEESWSCPMDQRAKMLSLPGERAWLTVVDDIGQRQIGRSPASIQNAWYDIFSRRTLPPRWTIITSNLTLQELLDQQTISESTYSRINQLTRGECLYFDGNDQRLT